MAQIRKGGKKEVPGVNTSSLPDIVFMLLFFFMATTTMKEVTYKVDVKVPEATELQKLVQKNHFWKFQNLHKNYFHQQKTIFLRKKKLHLIFQF